MHFIEPMKRLAVILTLCLPAIPLQAGVITLDATASGTYHSNGTFFISGNYAAGWFPTAAPSGELRNFFVFDLTGVTGTITAATLRAQNPATGYSSPDANETWSIFDASTSPATLAAGTGGLAAFTDLGSGTNYGSVTVDFTSNSANVDVALNAAALGFLNSASGSIAFGGAITTINFANTTSSERLFNSSDGTMTRQLILTIADAAVPEPGTMSLLAAGALFLLGRLRRFRP
jgi:hypothetical protein